MKLCESRTKKIFEETGLVSAVGLTLLAFLCFACNSSVDGVGFVDRADSTSIDLGAGQTDSEGDCIGNSCDELEDRMGSARVSGNNAGSTILIREELASGQYLSSTNGEYRFYLQRNGNLVLRDWSTRDVLWASGTKNLGGIRLRLQGDSNLVLFTDAREPVWSSRTRGSGATKLVLNNDGSLGLYSDENLVWVVNKKKPNVLFIVVDDLTKTLSTYDHPHVRTKHIDTLADNGIQFDNAYSNYPVCNPSRSSFLTGLKPQTIGVLDNKTKLQDVLGDRVTLPHLFKKNGYYTVSLGKVFHSRDNDPQAWHEVHGFSTTKLGKQGVGRNMCAEKLSWCRWLAAEGDDLDQKDGQIANKAISFIKERTAGDKPFFLAVGFHKPHDPFIAPKDYFRQVEKSFGIEDYQMGDDLKKIPLPDEPDDWTRPNNFAIPTSKWKVFTHPDFTETDKREFLRAYYACTMFIDTQVGKILDALDNAKKKDKTLENTLIVFLSDHGYHLGEHHQWNKNTLYEKATVAPFILSGPQVGAQGVRTDAMFEFIDIYPTLAELLGLKDVPKDLEGKSFVDVIRDPSMAFRDEVHAVITRGDVLGQTVKNREWRYTEWGERGERGKELYDQLIDPMEYENLAYDESYFHTIDEMRTLLYQDY